MEEAASEVCLGLFVLYNKMIFMELKNKSCQHKILRLKQDFLLSKEHEEDF